MKQIGFTLLELLITLFLVGILFNLAFPVYQKHLLHSRRVDAEAALLDLAVKMEEYFATHHTYKTATKIIKPKLSPDKWYKIGINRATKHTYILEAIAVNGQSRDTPCTTITLDQAGVKEKIECWR